MRRTPLLPAALALAAAAAASPQADPQSLPHNQHPPTSHRHARKFGDEQGVPDSVGNVTTHQLAKRGYNGRATFFAPGLGACGSYSSGGDMIVALNEAQYGDGCTGVSPYCFKEITISYGDKTHGATIVDCCPGCDYGGLDMSPGLFGEFAASSVGTFYMDWYIGDGGDSSGGDGSGSSPSSSSQPPPTSTSSKASSTSSSAASSSSAAAPSSPAIPGNWNLQGGNLDAMNQLVMALGNLVAQVAVQAAPSSSSR